MTGFCATNSYAPMQFPAVTFDIFGKTNKIKISTFFLYILLDNIKILKTWIKNKVI